MTVRGRPFARIVQVAPMKREDIGQAAPPSQRIANRSRGQRKMRIDDVVAIRPQEALARPGTYGDKSEQRQEAADRLSGPKEHRDPDDPDPLFHPLRWQAQQGSAV